MPSLRANAANIGSLHNVFKCSCKKDASLTTVIGERADRASVRVSKAKEMNDVRDKAVTSAAKFWKRMDDMHEWLGAAEPRACRFKEQYDVLSVEMEEAQNDVVHRLNFGSEERNELTAKLELMRRERNVLSSESKQLALEVQSAPSFKNDAKNFRERFAKLENANRAKASKSPSTRSKR